MTMKIHLCLATAAMAMGVGLMRDQPEVQAAAALVRTVKTNEDIRQWMPNASLRQIILKTLNNDPDIQKKWATETDITQTDLRLLTKLELTKENVTGPGTQTEAVFNLAGLEFAQNLTTLDLDGSVTNFDQTPGTSFGENPVRQPRGHVVDLAPIAKLSKLKTLILKHNQITDVRELANLKSVTHLDLSYCEIEDFSVLRDMPYDVFRGEGQLISQSVVFDGTSLEDTLENTSRWVDGSRYDLQPLARYASHAYTQETRHADNGDLLATTAFYQLHFASGQAQPNTAQGLWYPVLKQQVAVSPSDNFTTGKLVSGDRYAMLGEVRSPAGEVLWTYVRTYRFTHFPAPLTVSHVDTTGRKLKADRELLGALGTAYRSNASRIEGYQWKEAQGNVRGEFTETPQQVTHIYEKIEDENDTGVPEQPGTGDNSGDTGGDGSTTGEKPGTGDNSGDIGDGSTTGEKPGTGGNSGDTGDGSTTGEKPGTGGNSGNTGDSSTSGEKPGTGGNSGTPGNGGSGQKPDGGSSSTGGGAGTNAGSSGGTGGQSGTTTPQLGSSQSSNQGGGTKPGTHGQTPETSHSGSVTDNGNVTALPERPQTVVSGENLTLRPQTLPQLGEVPMTSPVTNSVVQSATPSVGMGEAPVSQTSASAQSTLPQTGEQDAPLAVLGLVLAGLTGMLFHRRRQK